MTRPQENEIIQPMNDKKGFARTGKGDWIVGSLSENKHGQRTVDGSSKCQNCGEYKCEEGAWHCSDTCEAAAIAELNSLL